MVMLSIKDVIPNVSEYFCFEASNILATFLTTEQSPQIQHDNITNTLKLGYHFVKIFSEYILVK